MNTEQLIDLLVLNAAAYLLGGSTDNAPDALKEVRDTFDRVMDECHKSGDPELITLTNTNGVQRRPIVFGDPFHYANLATMHASKAFAGDTENGEHEQVHHQQTTMSTHSLHSDNPGYSQTVMDRVI